VHADPRGLFPAHLSARASTPHDSASDAFRRRPDVRFVWENTLRTTTTLTRWDSLDETKLLVSTNLARTGSVRLESLDGGVTGGDGEKNGNGGIRGVTLDSGSHGALNELTTMTGSGELSSSPHEFLFADHFHFEKRIGRSKTSEAWLVRSKQSDQRYCVKKITAPFNGASERTRYAHEVEAVTFLPAHENVVKYFRAWQEDKHFFCQTELCVGGSFGACLERLPPGCLVDERDVWCLAKEIASGLKHVHEYGILHLGAFKVARPSFGFNVRFDIRAGGSLSTDDRCAGIPPPPPPPRR
jgi:membrane-associated tyrosine/threonine-specific cdc2-inhibitory kinase